MLSIPTYIVSHSKNSENLSWAGSLITLPAHWEGGARARFHNVAAKNPVRPRKNTAEGPPSLKLRTGERGVGNSAFPFLNQIEASPATLQFIARHHRKILFSLGEKEIRRPKIISALLFVSNRYALGQTGNAQNEKSKEYFSVVWRAVAGVFSVGGASLAWFRSGVFDKIGSSQTVKTHTSTKGMIYFCYGC